MRTSPSQFELLVDYMERHGDLNKSGGGPQERVTSIQHWDTLIKTLNTVAGGERKSLEKWKKVWSDLKNNTKKKAAKIQQAVNQNGFGPGRSKLTTLELRVLDLVKSQTIAGLPEVEEVGYELVTTAAPIQQVGRSSHDVVLVPDVPPTVLIDSSENEKLYIKEEDGQFKLLSSIEVEASSPLSRESVQDESHISTPRVSPSPTVVTSRRRSTSQRKSVSPSPAVTSRRRYTSQRRARRSVPRASTAPGQSAARYFVESDERWRSLFNKMATEHFRLREAELKQQAQWQVLFDKMITTIDKFA